jgi:hypothetical protein
MNRTWSGWESDTWMGTMDEKSLKRTKDKDGDEHCSGQKHRPELKASWEMGAFVDVDAPWQPRREDAESAE